MPQTKMRPIRETIPFDEALALILAAATPLTRIEHVRLEEAVGRVLADRVVATQDVPPFDRAAMDGYAVIAEDTFGATRVGPKRLRVIEVVHAGGMSSRTLGRGEAIEIATGAPMPAGADAVVMVENTDKPSPDDVVVFSAVDPRQHVGPRGADIQAGDEVLRAGDVLSPSRVGSIAALGLREAPVYERPRVSILSTGSELVEPGTPLGPGQIYEINKYTLSSVIREHGGVPVNYPTAPDSLEALHAALDRCLTSDILIFTGGSSAGERDLTRDVLQQRGELLFHGIAVKPGKPMAFGRIEGKPVLGMPGYPTSCLSNAYMLLIPLLRRIARLPPHLLRTIAVPTAQRIVSTTTRHQFLTVRLVDGAAVPVFKASGDITSMSRADGFIEIPTGTEVIEKGEMVLVKFF